MFSPGISLNVLNQRENKLQRWETLNKTGV